MSLISTIYFKSPSRWAKHWLVAIVRLVCQTSHSLQVMRSSQRFESHSQVQYWDGRRKTGDSVQWRTAIVLCAGWQILQLCVALIKQKKKNWLVSRYGSTDKIKIPSTKTYMNIKLSPNHIDLDWTFPPFPTQVGSRCGRACVGSGKWSAETPSDEYQHWRWSLYWI